jgi:hypothetical protein
LRYLYKCKRKGIKKFYKEDDKMPRPLNELKVQMVQTGHRYCEFAEAYPMQSIKFNRIINGFDPEPSGFQKRVHECIIAIKKSDEIKIELLSNRNRTLRPIG